MCVLKMTTSIHNMTKTFQISTLLLLTAFNFIEQVDARECGPPGMPLHGLINGNANWSAEMFNPGDNVTYTCSGENTRLMKGDDVRFCTADGQWSGTRPWCASNFIYKKPVTLEIYSLHNSRPTITQPPELTDGIIKSDSTSSCLLVSAHEKHLFKFDQLQNVKVHALWIYTEGHFPVLNNEMDIDVPHNWSLKVTTKSPTPSIFIVNDRLEEIDELDVGIMTKASFNICEMELYVQNGDFECGEPEVPAHGLVSIRAQEGVQGASYSCNDGYQLQGPTDRSCDGTGWSGKEPVCIQSSKIVTFSSLEVIDDGDEDEATIPVSMEVFLILIVLIVAVIGCILFWQYYTHVCKSNPVRKPESQCYENLANESA